MRSSRRGNLLLRNPLARGECAVRILFYSIGLSRACYCNVLMPSLMFIKDTF